LGAHGASRTVDGFSLFAVMASCWTMFSSSLGGKTVGKLITNNISKRLKNSEKFYLFIGNLLDVVVRG